MSKTAEERTKEIYTTFWDLDNGAITLLEAENRVAIILKDHAQQEVDRLNPLFEECLDAVRELNGEYQDGWDETIKKLEEVLNEAFYAQHIKPTE